MKISHFIVSSLNTVFNLKKLIYVSDLKRSKKDYLFYGAFQKVASILKSAFNC